MNYFSRLRSFWFPDWIAFVWLLLALPGLYFFQTLVHEGTHGVVAWIDNGDFPKVAPFPHLSKTVINGVPRIGRFQNGVTIPNKTVSPRERKDCDPKVAPTTVPPRLAGWIGWPQLIALLLTIGFAAVFVFVPITNPLIAFLLRAWYFGACVDLLFNTALILFGVCNDQQDWARVMIRGDHNSTLFWFITFFLWLVILSHFVWVQWSKWGNEPLAQRNFWDYRWIAVILGIASGLAVVFMLTVSDDHIEKGTIFFVVPLIVQILAFCWYWIYFFLTFKNQDQPAT